MNIIVRYTGGSDAEVEMVARPQPSMLHQPAGSLKCWAYALSSWMAVTRGRKPTGPEAIIAACRSFCVFGSDALNPKFIDRVLESPFIRMGWKVLDGTRLDLAEVDILLHFGYIYVIADVKRSPLAVGAPPPSHARLIYKNTDPKLVATSGATAQLGVMDPITGDTLWDLSDVANFNLILGFLQEDLNDSAATPPFEQWFARVNNKEVAQFTPAAP